MAFPSRNPMPCSTSVRPGPHAYVRFQWQIHYSELNAITSPHHRVGVRQLGKCNGPDGRKARGPVRSSDDMATIWGRQLHMLCNDRKDCALRPPGKRSGGSCDWSTYASVLDFRQDRALRLSRLRGTDVVASVTCAKACISQRTNQGGCRGIFNNRYRTCRVRGCATGGVGGLRVRRSDL